MSTTHLPPADRQDGRAKTSGAARYTAEVVLERAAHAFLVTSTVASGTIRALDAAAAEAAPGVVLVLSHLNAPRLAEGRPSPGDATVPPPEGAEGGGGPSDGDVFSRPRPVLQSPEVAYHGQPVAVVVAETFEQARRAAALVRVSYDARPPRLGLEARRAEAAVPAKLMIPLKPATEHGDVEAALAAAPVRVDATYRHPPEHPSPLEPAASAAAWDAGGNLFVWDATQDVQGTRRTLALTFGLPEDRVRVACPYLGGGFGAKHPAREHYVLAALAARAARRPVKLAATRRQTFTLLGHRPESVQRIRLGADREGRLLAVDHDILVETSMDGEFVEHIGPATAVLYAAGARRIVHRAVPLNVRLPTIVRAPGETPGVFALESAMDELAATLGLDPIELRRRNEPDRDPEHGLPWSSRALLRCFDEGARRFGWAGRDPRPGSGRDGRWLVGTGTAAATYPTNRLTSSARVTLLADGTARASAAALDVGTGAYTVLAQVAAAELGLPVGRVGVQLGDTALPRSVGAGGSWTTATVAPAVQAAARAKLAALAAADPASPLRGAAPEVLALRDGRLAGPDGAGEAVGELLARHGLAELAADAETAPDPAARRAFAMHAFGAVFAEVGVDGDTGEVRVRKALGVYGAGRILNPKTAASQMRGGIVWGISQALHEHLVVDPRDGRIVNGDLAEYHVPVHADVPPIEVAFLDEHDPHVNPLGVKGVGEIGIVGVAAAIANAVHHATGVRARDLPITLDNLLPEA